MGWILQAPGGLAPFTRQQAQHFPAMRCLHRTLVIDLMGVKVGIGCVLSYSAEISASCSNKAHVPLQQGREGPFGRPTWLRVEF